MISRNSGRQPADNWRWDGPLSRAFTGARRAARAARRARAHACVPVEKERVLRRAPGDDHRAVDATHGRRHAPRKYARQAGLVRGPARTAAGRARRRSRVGRTRGSGRTQRPIRADVPAAAKRLGAWGRKAAEGVCCVVLRAELHAWWAQCRAQGHTVCRSAGGSTAQVSAGSSRTTSSALQRCAATRSTRKTSARLHASAGAPARVRTGRRHRVLCGTAPMGSDEIRRVPRRLQSAAAAA